MHVYVYGTWCRARFVNVKQNLFSPFCCCVVPGGTDGPGGVLVCCENNVYWKSVGAGSQELRVTIPRRQGMNPKQPLLITSHATIKTKVSSFLRVRMVPYVILLCSDF